ncbi:hypothetical protein [Neorhodopirellula lusitana]|uniref:hypothetical protein n=1 Tax=Neorhodopirellula lusitana TaxID=445327 RepID=UPI0024B7612D|nr:hypothetical protein [Neorhodopirellula lusitana]
MDEAKAKAQESKKDDGLVFIPEFGEAIVGRAGYRWGGARGQHMEFALKIDGTEVGISRKTIPQANAPNIAVTQTGRDCLLNGGRERYYEIRDAIEALGCRIVWQKLSRADLAIDVAGLSVEILQDLFEKRQFITRAKRADSFHNRATDKRTGFHAGRAPCYLTVYDKLFECTKQHKSEYLNAMISRRWNGVRPNAATRIEWQLRRAKLRDFGVSTPGDLFQRSGVIFRKLMIQQFRFTEGEVDRVNKNQSRSTIHPLWYEIAHAAVDILGGAVADLTPIERGTVPPTRSLKTARGHLKSAMLDLGFTPRSYDEFVETANSLLLEIGNDEIERRVEQEAFMHEYHKAVVARGNNQPDENEEQQQTERRAA